MLSGQIEIVLTRTDVDVGTGLAILGSSGIGAPLILKLLGPTADYLGEGVRSWTEKRVNNVRRIFTIAVRRLGNRIDEEGGVPPRALEGIVREGSFCEDEIAAEYFGGVLASSRSSMSRDDRGASFIALLSRLSVYQIRAHYVFYSIIKRLFEGKDLPVTLPQGRQGAEAYISLDVFVTAMGFDEREHLNLA